MFHFYTHWKRQKTKGVFFVNLEPTWPIHDFSERNQLLQDVTGTLITVASNPVNFIRVNAENILVFHSSFGAFGSNLFFKYMYVWSLFK